MFHIGRFSWLAILGSLVLLRLAIGFHFYMEGSEKLRSGDFSAESFFRAARGPFSPYFHRLLEDENGQQRLCVISQSDDRGQHYQVDPELTIAIWGDFVDRAASYYALDDTQLSRARDILKAHQDELVAWLDSNHTELIAHFSTGDRLEGFEQDGSSKQRVALHVASLRGQVNSIRAARQGQLQLWTAQIEEMWNSFEDQINSLTRSSAEAQSSPSLKKPLALHRPFSQPMSKLNVINWIVPRFDVLVGGMLMLGLLTRFASLAGAGFLATVIATQPPWVPDASSTIYPSIELFALLVIFSTYAGRIGGLDFFIWAFRTRRKSQAENLVST